MTSPERRHLIFVIGMPRTGTSALTKGLSTLNISLGSYSPIGNVFNEKGYWEDQEVQALNEDMLKSLSTWKNSSRSILPITEEETHFLYDQGFITRASQLLSKKFSDSKFLGIKEVHTALLLPFWKRVLKESDIAVSFVIALRNPISTVASIAAFTKHPSEQSCWKFFWIWISFLLASIKNSEGHQRILVDYDSLLKDPSIQVKRIATEFQLQIDDESLKTYSADFIDPALCHFKMGKAIPDIENLEQEKNNDYMSPDFLRNFSMEMYHHFLAVAQDQIDFNQLHSLIQKWETPFLLAKPLLCLAEKNAWALEKLTDELFALKRDFNELMTEKLMLAANVSMITHQSHLQQFSP